MTLPHYPFKLKPHTFTGSLVKYLDIYVKSIFDDFAERVDGGWVRTLVTSGISLMLLVGAFIASLLLRDASNALIAVGLAFGSAALIYLIVEELLVEAIQAEKSLLSTAMLFTGFLVLLAFKLLS